MENEILTYLFTNISFGGLFIWLLWDTRKDSKQRELKYQDTIKMLGDKFEIVEDIKDDIKGIKYKLELK